MCIRDRSQVLHKLFRTDTFTLPLPSRILQIIGENLDKIGENVQATIIVALCGLFLGSLLGLSLIHILVDKYNLEN